MICKAAASNEPDFMDHWKDEAFHPVDSESSLGLSVLKIVSSWLPFSFLHAWDGLLLLVPYSVIVIHYLVSTGPLKLDFLSRDGSLFIVLETQVTVNILSNQKEHGQGSWLTRVDADMEERPLIRLRIGSIHKVLNFRWIVTKCLLVHHCSP